MIQLCIIKSLFVKTSSSETHPSKFFSFMVVLPEIKSAMSRSSLSKKLIKVKKMWNRITNTIPQKLSNFKLHKAIKTIKTNTNRILAFKSFRLFFSFKRQSLTRNSDRRWEYKGLSEYYYKQNQPHNNVSASAVYIDKLYTEPAVCGESREVVVAHDKVSVGKGKENSRSLYSVEDAWNAVVASSPQLRGVDERAEDFISKVREDMKLQKERSHLEFQEMLKRSA
ncbi:hypothetical protein HS088_TW14G00902 [Tripterygium wilfordii]|uniref:Uncharacterized protein n=1 Tax=Tripterygium wilfordii TaxID=458696 RepID=A0A7J7CS08_TRIWF|nr:uncharacterized protein LOC120014776 [Tripterygium wilfordii]KAF5736749.1 hypothetical protein HS088_TW14G00902 [Tripterygium wilfordii]